MKRKIIRQGHNTLTITLPSEWTKKLNLEAGNEIELVEKSEGMLLTAEKSNGKLKKAEINLGEMDLPTIWKYFMAVYREGYDEVLVKFNPELKVDSPYKFFAQHKLDIKYGKESKKKGALEFLYELVNRFIGFEIVDYGKDFVLIKDMSEPTYKEFDNSLRRVLLLVQQMSDETSIAIKTNKPKILSHIHDVDINLDKFHDYCVRVLNKKGNGETRKNSILFSILYLLELVGDEFKTVSHHLVNDFPKTDWKNVIDVSESIKQQIDLLYDLFYKFDLKKINDISKIDKQRYFDFGKMYKKTKTEEEKEIFHHFRVIAKYINALVELRIEMEY